MDERFFLLILGGWSLVMLLVVFFVRQHKDRP
jgi:hypothetical protein